MFQQELTYKKNIQAQSPLVELIETLTQGVTPFSTTIRTPSEAKIIKIHEDLLFIGLKNGEVRTYNLLTSVLMSKFSTNEPCLVSLTIDCPSSTIITVGKSSKIQYWSYEGFLLMRIENNHSSRITNILMTDDILFLSDINGNLSSRSFLSFKTVQGHASKITCLESKEIIVTGSHDCCIKAWDKTLNLLGTMTSNKFIHRICFISEKKLASAGSRSLFCIWNLNTYTLEREIQSEENWVRSIAGTFCENYIISGTNDSCVRYWNMQSLYNESFESFTAHDGPVTNICTNASGSLIITSGQDRTVKIWQACRELKKRSQLIEHTDYISCLIVSEDDKFLYSGSADRTICKWDISKSKLVYKLIGHTQSVTAIGIFNKKIISISEDRDMIIWKNEIIEKKVSFFEYLSCLCSCDDYIFIGGCSGKIFVHDIHYERVKEFEAHWNVVTTLVYRNKKLYSGSRDQFIKIWDTNDYSKIYSFKAHSSVVNKICLLPNENMLVSTGCDCTYKVWFIGSPPIEITFREHKSSISAIALNSNGWYNYTGDKEGNVIVWCNEEFVSMTSFKLNDSIHDICSLKFEPLIAIASGNKIHLLTDLLADNHLLTIPNTQSYLYFLYISCLLKGKATPFKHLFKDYIIMPIRLNILHIMAYINDSVGIKEALKCRVKFFSSDGENPLRIALNKKSYQSADIILKHIPIYRNKSNPYIYKIIENEIIELLPLNLKHLPGLLHDAFPIRKCPELPQFGEIKGTTIFASDSINLKPENFQIKAGGRNAIEFRVCIFQLPLEIGSSDCIVLLENIIKCSNPDIFDQWLIQSVLEYLMNKSYKILMIMALFDFISIMIIIFYFIYFKSNVYFSILILVVNLLFLIHEIMQMYLSFEFYLSDFWNIIDAIRIISSFLAVTFILIDCDSDVKRCALSFAMFFSMLRMISLFRLFSKTRYMIRIIFEVLADISSFLLILLMTTVTMALSLYFSGSKKQNFTKIFLNSYLLNFGQINIDEYDDSWLSITLFLFVLFLNPLVMMNLLIATMGDTFSRIHSSLVISNYKEIASIVLEACTFMFWKRKENNKLYLQSCNKIESESITENIPAKLKKIRFDIENLKGIVLENEDKIDNILNYFNQ